MANEWDGGAGAAEDLTPWRAPGRAAGRRRAAVPPPRQRHVARLFGWFVALGLLVSVALVAPVAPLSALQGPGGVLTVIGQVAAMAGTFLMLVALLLIARIPALEGALGQDRLVRWHGRLGPLVLGLIVTHVVAVTLGYAQQVRAGVLHEVGTLVLTFPGMLMAAASFGLLLLVALTSYRAARRRMRYETWWAVHLYTYLAAALSFPHQLWTGAPFLDRPAARAYWIALWLFTAGTVIGYRWLLPLLRTLRHSLRVETVEPEAPGVVSIVMRGKDLAALPVSGGQFLHWRFLRRGMWWQAHPYSLSALPSGDRVRITVKALGDHSESVARLKPGTRVAIEGPYGAFTSHARQGDRVLLVAAGVGSTPVRALLDDMPRHVDVVAILRGSAHSDLVLRDEIVQRVAERGGRVSEVVGSRSRAPLDAAKLGHLVPDIAERDVYVCGPRGFMRALITDARALGVPAGRIHHEDFTF